MVFRWLLRVCTLLVGVRLTSLSRFRASRTDVVLGLPEVGPSLTSFTLGVFFCFVLLVFLFLLFLINIVITLLRHPSFLAIALHNIPPFFIPINLHLSSVDSLRLDISEVQLNM